MVRQAISPSGIIEKLGEGATGVVWKSRDTRLDRIVAIKVRPQEKVAGDLTTGGADREPAYPGNPKQKLGNTSWADNHDK